MTERGGRAFLVGAGRDAPELLTLKARRMLDATVAHPGQPDFDWLDRQLLDGYQRDFPICEKPFAEIASRLRCQPGEVLRRLAVLERRGVVSRIGPVFAPERIGASTLAAMAVPRARLASVAEWLNRYPAVDHSYEREHEFNLWFVLAAPNPGDLYETLADIRRRTGLHVLDLRLERVYDTDLELPLPPQRRSWRRPPAGEVCAPRRDPQLDASDRRLVDAIQNGLSLTARPYAAVAGRIGLSEAQVMERLRRLLGEGVITRMGVVVRHCEFDYLANAMVVFDVPRARADMVGDRLAQVAPVTSCYRRTRRPPVWPYNLYCMLDGGDRAEVMGWVNAKLPDRVGDLRHTVLFSRRRFRQRGAPYGLDHAPPQWEQPAPWPCREAWARPTESGDARNAQ